VNISPYANKQEMLNDVQTILSNKKLWQDAKDDTTRTNIRQQTESTYERLRRNGYSDVAKSLTASNYEQSLPIFDNLSKSTEPLRTVTYTPDSDVANIYNNKYRYDNAKSDDEKKTIASQTQAYYNSLRDNGYNDVAHSLSTSNYEQAKSVYDKVMKTNKTATRDYFYDLGERYGMSAEEVDKLIGWDNDSKEVSFGGMKIGTPDAIVDGVSYWSDTSKLDKAFQDYIDRTGTTVDNGVDNKAYSQSMTSATNKNNEYWDAIKNDRTDVQGKYNDLYGYANSDVTKTDEYKSTYDTMMSKYDLSALQGRDNAVASGGASNGGNIDSYAAANALRQQAALTATGQQIAHQAGLDAYNARVNNARGILSDLGVYNQGTYDAMNTAIGNDVAIGQTYFENAETAKNNEVARKAKMADVTGYNPTEWTIQNDDVYSTYLNPDGSFKKEMENVDIQGLINTAKANGNTELANKLAVVRGKKILSDYNKYGQYASSGDISFITPQKTASQTQFDKTAELTKHDIDSSVAMNKYNTDASERMNAANNQNTLDQYDKAAQNGLTISGSGKVTSGSSLTASQASSALKNGSISQTILDVYNREYGTNYTMDNPPPEYKSIAPMSEKDVEDWVEVLNDEFQEEFGQDILEPNGKNKYKLAGKDAAFVILRVANSTDLTDAQVIYLLDKFGITEDQINAVRNDDHYKPKKGEE
jgi:hypothetical protein